MNTLKTVCPNLEGEIRSFIIIAQRESDQFVDILLIHWWWGKWEFTSSIFWFQWSRGLWIAQCIMLAAQSLLTLCDPMDSSWPGSSIHRILQARILEWAAISFSRRTSQPRNRTWVSCIAGRFFFFFLTICATREALWIAHNLVGVLMSTKPLKVIIMYISWRGTKTSPRLNYCFFFWLFHPFLYIHLSSLVSNYLNLLIWAQRRPGGWMKPIFCYQEMWDTERLLCPGAHKVLLGIRAGSGGNGGNIFRYQVNQGLTT